MFLAQALNNITHKYSFSLRNYHFFVKNAEIKLLLLKIQRSSITTHSGTPRRCRGGHTAIALDAPERSRVN